MIKMSVGDKRNYPLWFITNEIKGNHGLYILDTRVKCHKFEFLEELPAVGHKTASVVMSQALGSFPGRHHIHRNVPLEFDQW
jgi:endonuclease-3